MHFNSMFKKVCGLVLTAGFAVLSCFTQETDNEKVSVEFYITTDGAYYPESEYRSACAHMARLTGVYYGLEARTTLNSDIKTAAPLGDGFLLKDGNFVTNLNLELTPVTVKGGVKLTYTPVPFLSFSAGGSCGSGWSLLGWEGMSLLNINKVQFDADGNVDADSVEYEDLTPFKNWYYDFMFNGTFMFDTGAVFPGDWSHIVFAASYTVVYKGITGLNKNDIWEWQCADNNANGWQYDSSIILAYQMPLMLYRAGFIGSFTGHFDGNDYGEYGSSDKFYGNFSVVSISPMVQVRLTEKDTLTVLGEFSSRRSFKQEHDQTKVEPFLNYIGYEWYFRRGALSWCHTF